jgi:hypothetical protein
MEPVGSGEGQGSEAPATMLTAKYLVRSVAIGGRIEPKSNECPGRIRRVELTVMVRTKRRLESTATAFGFSLIHGGQDQRMRDQQNSIAMEKANSRKKNGQTFIFEDLATNYRPTIYATSSISHVSRLCLSPTLVAAARGGNSEIFELDHASLS